MRSVEWDYQTNTLRLIDQRILPAEFRVNVYADHHAVAQAIYTMVVRGAPAIGATAAFAMALAAFQSGKKTIAQLRQDLNQAAEVLMAARPTAVNLAWAVRRMQDVAQNFSGEAADLPGALLTAAQVLADEDVAINRRIAEHGAALVKDGDTIIHHCNTGALATVDWGTALGVIRFAHAQGKRLHVLVDETRPRLQGARLTAWELEQYQIPYDLITDNAAGFFLKSGQVNLVLFGGDRMAANGDVANKIGTYMLALAASDNQVPAFSVVPTSTVDLSIAHGGLISIEERDPAEVLDIQSGGHPVAPAGASARNPAFDVTPARLLTGIITEFGVFYPPFEPKLRQALSTAANIAAGS